MADSSARDRVDDLVRFLAGAESGSGAPLRESDEILIEVLAGLPREGDLAAMFDVAGVALLSRAQHSAEPDEEPPDLAVEAILREATFRLLRVVVNLRQSLPNNRRGDR